MTKTASHQRPAAGTQPRLVFFAGKGGVGKTTCAAAAAIAAAAAGSRVLVVSTDPAHSLGDAVGVALSARPKTIRPRLDAVEIDAPRAFERWLDAHRQALGDALEQGTWLDRSDVEALLDLRIPGVDELVGWLEIARLGGLDGDVASSSRARYDLVVVDTAPTGHALRLLAAPDAVAALSHGLDALRAGHRIVREQLARVNRPEAADRLSELLASQAAAMASVLRDRARTTVQWVTLPEALSRAESADGIAALTTLGLHVEAILVNRLLPDYRPCPLCDRRRIAERRVLSRIRRTIGRGRRVRIVLAHVREPRGIPALKRLFTDVTLSPRVSAPRRLPPMRPPRTRLTLDAVRGAELLLVGGKGGVGKTTIAAAIALQLARAQPDSSILLLSTDPAHSLADVLDAPIGDAETTVHGAPRNLMTRELDAPAAFQAKRDALVAALVEIASSLGAGELNVDELMELAPPGIDELFAMLSVVAARAAHRIVVVDTAPTGHALRLLEMPETAREWTQALMRVLLKYRDVARPGRFAAELVDASRSVRELQALLRDPARARFLVVTRAAAVPRAETERLLRRLRALKLSIPLVIVNARTLGPGSCRRCRAARRAERREVAALARALGSRRHRAGRSGECAIIETPLAAPPPQGPAGLTRWARTWIA